MSESNAGGEQRDGKCILVVEDEMFIAFELQRALNDGGFRVLGPVASLEDALHLLDDQRPDAAVLDFNLGREKVTPVALQLETTGIPFVLASATDATELARYTVFAHTLNIGKPTDMKRLVSVLRTMTVAQQR
jgi:DNA-binding response OmpR family regulator